MDNTLNMVCVFIGGAVTGGLITAGVMKKLGYSKELNSDISHKVKVDDVPLDSIPTDTPSYKIGDKIDTHKTSYSSAFSKPDLEEVSKKYKDSSFDEHMAEREHPEEDPPEELTDEEQDEISETMVNHAGFNDGAIEMEEIDGYGHVIGELNTGHSDQLAYLISEEYIGEIYPIEELFYYEKDEILTDANDAVIDDPTRIIGDALEHFGQYGIDPDTVHVRNCSIGIEYEITCIDGYFAAKIYGIKDEDLEGGAMSQIPRKSKKKHAHSTEDDEE